MPPNANRIYFTFWFAWENKFKSQKFYGCFRTSGGFWRWIDMLGLMWKGQETSNSPGRIYTDTSLSINLFVADVNVFIYLWRLRVIWKLCKRVCVHYWLVLSRNSYTALTRTCVVSETINYRKTCKKKNAKRKKGVVEKCRRVCLCKGLHGNDVSCFLIFSIFFHTDKLLKFPTLQLIPSLDVLCEQPLRKFMVFAVHICYKLCNGTKEAHTLVLSEAFLAPCSSRNFIIPFINIY